MNAEVILLIHLRGCHYGILQARFKQGCFREEYVANSKLPIACLYKSDAPRRKDFGGRGSEEAFDASVAWIPAVLLRFRGTREFSETRGKKKKLAVGMVS